jgi:hypothetical protein
LTKTRTHLLSKPTNLGVLIMVSTPVQGNQTLSVTSGADGAKIASGSTTPGSTNWQAYGENGIYVDVDTNAAGFTTTPVYVTSIGGEVGHWATTGGSSVYQPGAKGFRIYIRWERISETGEKLTPQIANTNKWHINWIAVEPSTIKTTPLPEPNKYYKLVNKKSGRCIDMAGVSTDGAILRQWDNVNSDNLMWQFQAADSGYYNIVSQKSGKLICVVGGGTANGVLLHQWGKIGQQGSDDQKWRLEDAGNGYFYIINKKSNKFMSVVGGNTANAAQLHQYDNVGADDQKWKFEAV